MIKFLIRISTNEDDLILDYFAGSGSTAQAVYEINEEDNRNNHYILIQLQEEINKGTTCYKKCIELNIKPQVSDIMLYRINKFLEFKNNKIDYDLKYI